MKVAGKIIFTLLIFGIIFTTIDPHTVLVHFKQIDPILLLTAFLFFNFSKIISSLRLNRYFNIIGVDLSETKNIILYYIGMFYNLFLPGGIGGDGYKIYLLNKQYQTPIKTLIAATLLDRISGLIPLVFLCSGIFFWTNYTQISPLLNQLITIIFFICIPLFYLFSRIVYPKFKSIFTRTLFIGIIVQLLQLLCAYILILALGIEKLLFEFLFLFLLSSITAVLPLTIGGSGLREVVFIYGLSHLQVEISLGIAFAMLFFFLSALSSFVGIFLKNPLIDQNK
ncbi:MAG: flippase-like domain-containing protein [Epsilonproteobacteria bacterium]|nr:flippase-like domain-containing protein [Campylobacterota bacterium]